MQPGECRLEGQTGCLGSHRCIEERLWEHMGPVTSGWPWGKDLRASSIMGLLEAILDPRGSGQALRGTHHAVGTTNPQNVNQP